MTEHAGADDTLLASVLWLCRHHGVERSRASLLAPLGLASPLTPETVQQVLREAGFQSSLVQRDPTQVLGLLLPVVLLLQDGQACVLVDRVACEPAPGDATGVRLRVLLPTGDGTDPVERWLGGAELLARSTGQVLIAMPALDDGTGEIPAVSYTHLRAHETSLHLVCRLLLEKKKILDGSSVIACPIMALSLIHI